MVASSESLERKRARRLIALALLRSLATAAVLFALYYWLPLDGISRAPTWLVLSIGMAILVLVSSWQLRAIVSARYPTVRGVEALATTVPLFLLLFSAAYYVMARSTPDSFSAALSRTDSLYFTVTVFATVGFGDIHAVSQSARVVVTVQMVLDLLVLGLGIRVFVGAVERGRQRRGANGGEVANSHDED